MSTTLLQAARVSDHESQQIFDTLLRTLAEPGTIRRLPWSLDRAVPAPLWLPLALADVGVKVFVDDLAHHALVLEATGASMSSPNAAWIDAFLDPNPECLRGLALGTALTPEQGARVALPVKRLSTVDRGEATIVLSGPGVPGSRLLTVEGLPLEMLHQLGTATGPSPTGFDTWLFTNDGSVAAIPRTTHITSEGF